MAGDNSIPTWDEISGSDLFRSMPSADREQVRLDFFNDFVVPNVPSDALDDVRASFDQDTRPTALGLTSLDDFKKANPLFAQVPDAALFDHIRQNYYPDADKGALARQLGYATNEKGGFIDFAKDVGSAFSDLPEQTAAAMEAATLGNDPVAIAASETQKRARDLQNQRALEPNKEYFLGLTSSDIRSGIGSLPFSLGSLGAYLVASLPARAAGAAAGTAIAGPPGAAIGGIVAGHGAGMAASAKAGYNMDLGQVLSNLYGKANEEVRSKHGRDMTPEEFKNFTDDPEIQNALFAHGAAEAGFEAIGNLITTAAFGKVMKPVVSKIVGGAATDVATKVGPLAFAKAAGKSVLGELATETPTQMVQNRAEVDIGLDGGNKPEYTSPPDWMAAFKEVAWPTIITTGIIGGGAKIASMPMNAYGNRVLSERINNFVANGGLSVINDDQLEEIRKRAAEVSPTRPKDEALAGSVAAIQQEISARADKKTVETVIGAPTIDAAIQATTEAVTAAPSPSTVAPTVPTAPTPLAPPAPRVIVSPTGAAATETQLANNIANKAEQDKALGITPGIRKVIEKNLAETQTRTAMQDAFAKMQEKEASRRIPTLLEAVIRAGGIHPDDRMDTIGDTRGNKSLPGVGHLFTKTGDSIDGMAEKLTEAGWFTEEQRQSGEAVNKLQEMVKDELSGVRQYTHPSDINAKMRREMDAYYADRDREAPDLSSYMRPVDLDLSGYSKYDEHRKDLTALFMVGREKMGEAAFEALSERISTQNPDATDVEFERIIRKEIESHAKQKTTVPAQGAGRTENVQVLAPLVEPSTREGKGPDKEVAPLVPATSAPTAPAAPGFGDDNKVFTKERADKAREILRKKLSQINAGLDPELMQAAIELSGHYIEGGARKFKDFSAKMVADLGEAIRPYLRALYLSVRNWPGFDNKGMQTEAEIDAKPMTPQASSVPLPPPRKPSKKAQSERDAFRQRLTDYFQPGAIVKSYYGHDRVLSLELDAPNGWHVQVISVIKKGDEWVDEPNARPRWHSTVPSQDIEPVVRPAPTPVPTAEAKGQQADMFGGKNETKQAVADREAERQRKMRESSPMESGSGDPFSGKSRQTDIEDVTKRPTDRIKEETGEAVNDKVSVLVNALNDAGFRTTMSGDLYGNELVYVDLDAKAAQQAAMATLPEPWVLTSKWISITHRDVLGRPIPEKQEGMVKNIMQSELGRKDRIARKGGAVTAEEAERIVAALKSAKQTVAATDVSIPEKPIQAVAPKNNNSNVVIRQVRDRDANNLGTIVEPYDGTMEGARAAAQRANDRMWDKYGDASNIQSRIGATDENGNPKWAITPNLKHIQPADSVEGRAIFGDEDAIFATSGKRPIEQAPAPVTESQKPAVEQKEKATETGATIAELPDYMRGAGKWWDALTKDRRLYAAMKAGWTTAKGTPNFVARNLAKQSWVEIANHSRATLARKAWPDMPPSHRLTPLEYARSYAPETIVASDNIKSHHRKDIKAALERGDDVPEKVLSEYPDIAGTKPEERAIASVTESKATVPEAGDGEVATASASGAPRTALDTHDEFFGKVYEGTATVEDFKQHFEDVVTQEQVITDELSKLTKDAVLKRLGSMWAHRYKNENKARVVSQAYQSMLDDFTLGESLSFMVGGGNYRQSQINAIRKIVDNVTTETLTKFAERVKSSRAEREQKIAGMMDAVKDPKTLEDFETFLGVKKRADLNQEQRERYDELRAEKSRGERKSRKTEERTTVRAAGATTSAEIIATKHTQKGYDLFVVKAAERVERDVYNAWNATAKKLGGWYSSYNKGGAIPGFQFKTRESAEAFQKYVSGGDTDAVEEVAQARRDAFADDRSQTAVERLREMADRLDERADESLGRERKENTDRRARMAASAEANANHQKSLAKTMRNVAQAIEDGKAKFLDQTRQKVQVEMLNSFVTSAKYRELREKYKDYAEQEKHRGEVPTSETVEYAEWPTYTAYRSDLAKLGRELLAVDGLKLIGQRLLKVADDITDAYTKFAKENLHLVSRFSTKDGGRPVFPTKDAAENAIARSGHNGKATSIQIRRGQHMIVMGPSEAQRNGIWEGDDDKRITLTPDFGTEIVEKAARRRLSVPHYFESVHEQRKRFAAMGIETPAEFRSALREFIRYRETPPEADKVKQMERAMIGRRKDGLDFFPTPADTADQMVQVADIKEGMSVLEPSAGMGHIADRIREAGFDVDVVELSGDRRELLEAKGYSVVGTDFMEMSDKQYDRIIMNPPFSDRRDMQHIQHAYGLLKPGGRVVAIMGEGVFFGSDKKATEFREWLESVGGTDEKLDEGTFQDTSLPVNTGANARMVVIDKPTGKDAAMYSRGSRPLGSDDTMVSAALSILARNDEFFQLPVSDAKSMAGIAAEVYPDIQVREVGRDEARTFNVNAVRAWTFGLPDKTGKLQAASVIELPGREIYLNVSDFREGGAGNRIYHITANFAYNNGMVFVGDPYGLSDAAMYRRTENMLASALKFGTTKHLAPHERQLEGDKDLGVMPLDWEIGDDARNINSLAEVAYSSVVRSVPEMANIVYNFETHRFEDVDGNEFSDKRFMELATRPGARKARAGRNTLKRTALVNSLVQTEGSEGRSRVLGELLRQSSEHLDKPLAEIFYSRDRATSGLPVSVLRAHISKAIESLTVPVKLYDTAAAARADGIDTTDDAKGFSANGRIGLIAENIPDKRTAESTLWHEVQHAGIRALNKSSDAYETYRGYQATLSKVAMANPNVRQRAAEWRAKHGQDKTKQYRALGLEGAALEEAVRIASWDEAIADIAGEKGWKHIKFMHELVAALQRLLRALGFENLAVWMDGKTEVLSLIRRSMAAVMSDATDGMPGADAPAYSQGGISVVDALAYSSDRSRIDYHASQISKYAEQIGWTVERETGSGSSGSRYVELSHVTERDQDGEASDWENVKIRISDHVLPPTYKALQGEADFEVVPDSATHDDAQGDWRDAVRWLAKKAGQPVPAAVRRADSAETNRTERERREREDSQKRYLADRKQAAQDYSPEKVRIERDRKSVTARFGVLSASNFSPIPGRAEVRARRTLDALVEAIRQGNDPAMRDAAMQGQPMFARGGATGDTVRFHPLRDRADKTADYLVYNYQDKFIDLKRIQKRAGDVPEDMDAYLAQERYPGQVSARVKDFHDDLLDPLIKAMHDAGLSYDEAEQYLHARHAPSRNAAMRQINPTEAQLESKKAEVVAERDRLRDTADVKRYLDLRRRMRTAEADIEDGIADESLRRVLEDDMRALMRDSQDVRDYTRAVETLRGLERIEPYQGDNTALSGMSDEKAAEIIEAARRSGRQEALDRVAGMVDEITAKTREVIVDAGLEKPETIAAWEAKYEHYVPLHRDEVGEFGMPALGQGYNVRGPESKRATGSTKDVTDILAHVAAQHEAAIIRAEKVKVDRALYDFARANPDESLWTLDTADKQSVVDPVTGTVTSRVNPLYKLRPNVLTFKLDGEERTITFNEKNPEAMRLAVSMKNLAAHDLGEVTNLIGKFTRFLATMNTSANPVFVARNFLRDLSTAFINLSDTELADMKKDVYRDIPKAIRGFWQMARGNTDTEWGRYAREFRDAGGQTGWLDHYKDIGERAGNLRKQLAAMDKGAVNFTKQEALKFWSLIEDANLAVENGVRLAAYVNARKAGLSDGKAASLAKNLTVNFNRHGAKGVELNMWYMFMNASIQGTARVIRALGNRNVQKIIGYVIASGFLMDILARALAGDGDDDGENDYDQLAEHVKAMNFVFWVNGRAVTIPMPYGYNFFASVGRKMSESIFRKNYSPLRSATDLVNIAFDAFSPTGQSGSMLQFVAPTIADPFVQWAENKAFHGGPLRREQLPFGPPKPEYQMGFKSTSAPAKWLAETLNDFTGGNEVRPGFINMNPAMFDFAVTSLAGGAGRTYLQVFNLPIKTIAGDEIQPREVPFVNIFSGAKPEYQTERKFYENIREVERARDELKHYRSDTAMTREIRERSGAEIRLAGRAKFTLASLESLRKQERRIEKSRSQDSRERLTDISERRRALMARFNKAYQEAQQ